MDEPTLAQTSPTSGVPDFFVVMGIAGTGKTEIAQRLAQALGASFVEADTFHNASNVERMRNGIGLTDEDRWPWLNAVCDAALAERRPVVIACSVLKRRYRDLFRQRLGFLRILFLHGSIELIAERLQARKNHFASASLLESQVQTLEAPATDENPIIIDIAGTPEAIVARVRTELGV
ncbi:gluconokinase [Mesorhizobium sp. DCY119]|uniref:gluconokinase n=1 Tax=Mesorhizobium sp. DCY119 TaxID=2108445 RepID=UPI000E6C13AC|nr:gluconokinase [Mesorhizobium sp. DCY119]RJG47331.1 gluconokinase [Mesorhizobium sp. DCY119]